MENSQNSKKNESMTSAGDIGIEIAQNDNQFTGTVKFDDNGIEQEIALPGSDDEGSVESGGDQD